MSVESLSFQNWQKAKEGLTRVKEQPIQLRSVDEFLEQVVETMGFLDSRQRRLYRATVQEYQEQYGEFRSGEAYTLTADGQINLSDKVIHLNELYRNGFSRVLEKCLQRVHFLMQQARRAKQERLAIWS
jgi:hypothetical protein